MAELEKMSHEEAEPMMTLENKILAVIEAGTDYTYQDVMCALDAIKRNYERRGSDLLNSVSIQEVANPAPIFIPEDKNRKHTGNQPSGNC